MGATAADEHRWEAELGARWALRSIAALLMVTVTVTEVMITEVDTGAGDVYEATARAVLQALDVEHKAQYVGFSDPEMVLSELVVRSRRQRYPGLTDWCPRRVPSNMGTNQRRGDRVGDVGDRGLTGHDRMIVIEGVATSPLGH